MRLMITGSRYATIADHGLIVQRAILGEVRNCADDGHPHEIYVGDAGGVDLIARHIGRQRGFGVHEFEANWEECAAECSAGHRRAHPGGRGDYCPQAGVRRNRVMVAAFVDAGGQRVLAFPAGNIRSTGTRGCIAEAKRAGLSVPMPIELTVERPPRWGTGRGL